MAQDKWLNTSGGDFATASDWSTGAVPGSTTDALLTTFGTYTVTSGQNETVNSIQIAQHVTLSITGGTFYAENGSGSGLDSGLIAIGNNTNFEAGGTIAGAGTIQLNSGGNGTEFILNANVALSGGGALVLDDNANNYVLANSASYVLSNVSDTISGAGQFGNGAMSFSNGAAGVVDANAAGNALVLNFGAGVATNAGLIESTGTAGLVIRGSTITQSGTGTIKAVGAAMTVSLDNAIVIGGTLATTGGGVIQSVSNAEVGGLTISAASTVSALNNTALKLDNTITNDGTITLDSGGNGTDLIVNTATVTLTGGGKLILSDNANNDIYSAGSTDNLLVNVNNVISGGGTLGDGQLSLDNQAAGIINANAVNALVVDPGAGTITNEGLMEATNTGALYLFNAAITNTGTILATGTGDAVDLNGATIAGGTLTTTKGGVIQSVNTGTLDGNTHAVTITAGSTVADDNDEYLYLNGSIVNDGTVALDSVGNGTILFVNSPTVTLTGGGQVVLSDNANNYIESSNGTAPYNLLVNTNDTISGSGQFGNGQLSVFNKIGGTINSNGAVGLTINTGGGSFTNAGLLEDTGTGGLGMVGATTIVNTGTIAATGAGSHVDLYNTTVQGGTLKTSGGGVIQSTNVGTLNGSTSAITITTGSQIVDNNDQYLYLEGSIVNQGTISADSGGNGTFLWIDSAKVTLTGAGAITLTDNTNNDIAAVTSGNKLINVNNVISGSGQIGNGGELAIDNQAAGIIDSNGVDGLTIDNAGAVSFTNEGLIEDTNTGGLGIGGGTTIVNTGTIAAFGAGSSVDLFNTNTTIQGGTLATSGGGVIQSTDIGTLDGSTSGAVTITTGSQIADLNNDYLYLEGSIVNQGTISIESSGNGTFLWVNSPTVTLTGVGAVNLSDNTNNYIAAVASGNKLVNVNNVISGGGQIGNGGALAVDNQTAGVIDANGGSSLVINNAGSASFTNEGLIEDTGTGGLSIVGGTTIVNTGTIAAFGAGSFINLANANTTIQGGTLATNGGGVIQSVDQGVLDGATGGALTITAGSQIIDNNNEYLFLKGSIVNHGTISVVSGGNGTFLWISSPVVTLSGGGAVTLTDNANNYITATIGGYQLVNFNNILSGAGQIGNGGSLLIDNQAGATIDATGGNNLNINLGGAAFTNEGTAEGTGSGGLLIQNTTLTNTGTIASLSGSNVNIVSSTSLTNFSAGTLTGGTYEAISAGGSNTSTLTLASGPITTDNAHLVISGTGASIVAGGTSVVSTIATIGAAGELDIQNGASFAAAEPLTVSGTILLSGSLSASTITTLTKGVISANSGLGAVSTSGRFINNGTLQATRGGTLDLTKGTLSNAGTVIAQAGGVVVTTASEKLSNLVTGTLTGGTWSAIGTGATLSIAAGTITSDAAMLTLSGAGSSIKSGTAAGHTLETSLVTVAATGQLNVLNSRGFASTVAGGITDSGVISLGGGSFSDLGLTIASGATFQGGGTLAAPVIDNGTLLSSAAPAGSTGSLSVTGAISGIGLLNAGAATQIKASGGYAIGTIVVAAAATLTGAGSASGAVTVGGTLAIGATGTLTAGSVTLQAGGMISGASVVASGSVADSGLISLSGGTLAGSSISIATSTAALTGYGTVLDSIANSGTIDAHGGTLTLSAGESGGVLQADANATLSGTGIAAASLTIATGGSFIGSGTVSGATTDSGTLTASGGMLTLASESGTGSAVIAGGATLDSTSALTLSGVTFASGSEDLKLGTPSGNTAIISGFANGTTIDLLNATVTSFLYAPVVGIMTLMDGTTSLGTLKFAGSYTKTNFTLKSDGASGTDILFVSGGNAAPPSDAFADLHAAVAATAGSAQSAGLSTVAAAPAPAAILPELAGPGTDLGVFMPTAHAMDVPSIHASIQ